MKTFLLLASRASSRTTGAFALVVLCCLLVHAQTPTGALAGTVSDQTGALVAS